MKKIHKGVALNLIAPGFGQFSVGRPARGILMFGGALAVIFIGGWMMAAPLIRSICSALSWTDPATGKPFEPVSFLRTVKILVVSFLFFFLVWGWSFLDILILKPKEDPADEKDPEP